MYFLGPLNVSVGHDVGEYCEVCPAGALMRVRTFSAARTAAAPPFVIPSPSALFTMNSVRPAFAIFSLPPTRSESALVSIT